MKFQGITMFFCKFLIEPMVQKKLQQLVKKECKEATGKYKDTYDRFVM